MNKKAQGTFSIFHFMIVAFIAVIFFASLVYTMGLINDIMYDVGVNNDKNSGGDIYVNLTLASEQTFGKVNESIQALRMVSIVYILALAVIIIITNALQRKHPLWYGAYIFIALLAVIFAPTISNAYETLLGSGLMDNTLQTFTASNFIVLNLPIIVMVISLLGGVFLFINLIRTEGEVANL